MKTNSILLVGLVETKPRIFEDGIAFNLAVERGNVTDYHRVVATGALAAVAKGCLTIGSKIAVNGMIEMIDMQFIKHHQIRADQINFLSE